MKIKLIDFGVPEHQRPYVRMAMMPERMFICPMTVPYSPEKSPKFLSVLGWEIPDGYAGYIFPRTSMAVKGLVCELRLWIPATEERSMRSSAM